MIRRVRPLRALALATVVALAGTPGVAHAWYFVGFGPFFPFYAPVPFYPAPAVVYAQPPVVYTPPGFVPRNPNGTVPPPLPRTAAGPACYAGNYICPLTAQIPPGGPCSCPAEKGRVSGTVR